MSWKIRQFGLFRIVLSRGRILAFLRSDMSWSLNFVQSMVVATDSPVPGYLHHKFRVFVVNVSILRSWMTSESAGLRDRRRTVAPIGVPFLRSFLESLLSIPHLLFNSLTLLAALTQDKKSVTKWWPKFWTVTKKCDMNYLPTMVWREWSLGWKKSQKAKRFGGHLFMFFRIVMM